MTGLRLFVAGALVVMVTGCVSESNSTETLPPLVSRDTTALSSEPEVSAPPIGTESETFATPLSVEPTVSLGASPSSTLTPRPVGDWDDARFDVGRIAGMTKIDEFPAIRFDRYSYQDPQSGPIDATGFDNEPVKYWWTNEPFVNQSTTVRRFVLAPDVEVLVLADAGEDRACTTPQPDPLPPPTWTTVQPSFLDTENATQAFASLTYSEDGLVEQVRFTRGC
jgi:hypothetical protein